MDFSTIMNQKLFELISHTFGVTFRKNAVGAIPVGHQGHCGQPFLHVLDRGS